MAVNQAQSTIQQELSDLDFKSMSTSDADYMIRQHKIEAINKFTLALSCLDILLYRSTIRSHHPKGRTGFPCRHLRTCIHRLLYPRQYRIQNVKKRNVGHLVRKRSCTGSINTFGYLRNLQGNQRLFRIQYGCLQRVLHETARFTTETPLLRQGSHHHRPGLSDGCRETGKNQPKTSPYIIRSTNWFIFQTSSMYSSNTSQIMR